MQLLCGSRATRLPDCFIKKENSAFHQIPAMEMERAWFRSSESDRNSKELDVAVRVVQMVCSLCEKVQDNLITKSNEQVKSKDDNSPVTIADWSVQATVSWMLSENFGSENVSIVAEEDIQTLTKPDSVGILEAVVKTVNQCLIEAPDFGLTSPVRPLGTTEVLEAISRCNSTGGPSGRHWVLDPVDGTLGFVRGDQYAIALALIEDGVVALGVLGCPNYPMNKEWLNYHHRYYRIMSKLSSPTSGSWDKGCVMYARKGSGKAWMQPLVRENNRLGLSNLARAVQVSFIDDPALATFCEPVEKSNSSHSFTAGLAHSVGLRNQPLRVYSMVKYAAIARGDAEIFMKFAKAGYKEKIWDHAAGVVIIQEAGGVVTDAGGRPLDFSQGIYLEGLDRGIIACSGVKLHQKIIRAVDASWDSSNL
ncbi:PAP-specific phosphatase HAL2-like [Telopea speciosissima]|uniref:PAP-specific phosphatase HAL2-like n=1 Tax=Telopea speciosissima TaxID=54955 RepID=UPI001CC7BA71|nr:PAP-specific phosphatase HAL2-like [Telopea speciosissima]